MVKSRFRYGNTDVRVVGYNCVGPTQPYNLGRSTGQVSKPNRPQMSDPFWVTLVGVAAECHVLPPPTCSFDVGIISCQYCPSNDKL